MTIFEKIINKEIPAYILYEDDLVISFLDIMQTTKGHALVVTKSPYRDFLEVPDDVLAHLIKITKKIANAINKSFKPMGINLINNNGAKAGQTVFHYHMHIIPRYEVDGLNITYENNMNNLNDNEYKKRALIIRDALL